MQNYIWGLICYPFSMSLVTALMHHWDTLTDGQVDASKNAKIHLKINAKGFKSLCHIKTKCIKSKLTTKCSFMCSMMFIKSTNLLSHFLSYLSSTNNLPGYEVPDLSHFFHSLLIISCSSQQPWFPINPITISKDVGPPNETELGRKRENHKTKERRHWWKVSGLKRHVVRGMKPQLLRKKEWQAVGQGQQCLTTTFRHKPGPQWTHCSPLTPPPTQAVTALVVFPLKLPLMTWFYVLFSFCQVIFYHPHISAGWVHSGLLPRQLRRGAHVQQSPSFHRPNPHPLKSSTRPALRGQVRGVSSHSLSTHTGVPFKSKWRGKPSE